MQEIELAHGGAARTLSTRLLEGEKPSPWANCSRRIGVVMTRLLFKQTAKHPCHFFVNLNALRQQVGRGLIVGAADQREKIAWMLRSLLEE